jgi:hypothetical protein
MTGCLFLLRAAEEKGKTKLALSVKKSEDFSQWYSEVCATLGGANGLLTELWFLYGADHHEGRAHRIL